MKIKVEIDAPDVADVAAATVQAVRDLIIAAVPIVISLKKSMDEISTGINSLVEVIRAGVAIEDETEDEDEDEDEDEEVVEIHHSWPLNQDGGFVSPVSIISIPK